MVEQNLDFITELSDRVLLLQKGVISGEVKGADAANPALIEEFTGFGGGGSGGAARRNPAPARRRKPCAALGFRARRACRRGAGRPSAVRPPPAPRRDRPRRARPAIEPPAPPPSTRGFPT